MEAAHPEDGYTLRHRSVSVDLSVIRTGCLALPCKPHAPLNRHERSRAEEDSSCVDQLEKFRRQFRTDAFIFVLKKDVSMILLLREDSFFPSQKISAAVCRAPEPDIAPLRGRDHIRILVVIGLGCTERAIALA
jgi:hypothetical protein